MYATHIKHTSILQNLRKQAVAAKISVMYRLLGVFYATKKGLYLFAQHSQYQYFSWKKKHLKLVIASGFCVAFLLRIKVEWQFCSKIFEYFKLYLMPTPEAWSIILKKRNLERCFFCGGRSKIPVRRQAQKWTYTSAVVIVLIATPFPLT